MASRCCWVLYCELVTFGFEMNIVCKQDLVSLRPFFSSNHSQLYLLCVSVHVPWYPSGGPRQPVGVGFSL